ncbi:hypothetical protein M3201_03600 [Paenibacillus motobuensis]|uniref:hypothetical protein n=1 Tax=Paenibacillus TaxID=44249 RepID=UPI00203CEE7A|nr:MULTISPECIES: hypothetical protein [Paenibacillus]MCM3038785.1 hypothetical protein [Paenibacillus lutimineralis]MCM3645889.1 hypothetical protein [Paenibacillus motobuensis]
MDKKNISKLMLRMMKVYIVKASNGKYQWISGIFKEEKEVQKFIKNIPTDLKDYQKLIELKNLNYPFYIIESENEFEYIVVDELLSMIDGIELTEDKNRVYFNIYLIESDYRPNKPGTDYMGIIKHEHVTNDFIEWYKKKGESFLIQRGIL